MNSLKDESRRNKRKGGTSAVFLLMSIQPFSFNSAEKTYNNNEIKTIEL